MQHSKGTRMALKLSGTQGTWALGHLKSTWALKYSGTLRLEALEALYFGDSDTKDGILLALFVSFA